MPYPRLRPALKEESADETAGEDSPWNNGQDNSRIGRTKQKQHVTVLLRICQHVKELGNSQMYPGPKRVSGIEDNGNMDGGGWRKRKYGLFLASELLIHVH